MANFYNQLRHLRFRTVWLNHLIGQLCSLSSLLLHSLLIIFLPHLSNFLILSTLFSLSLLSIFYLLSPHFFLPSPFSMFSLIKVFFYLPYTLSFDCFHYSIYTVTIRAGWYGSQTFKLSVQLDLLVCYSKKNVGVIRFFLSGPLTPPPSQNFFVKIFIIWNFYKSLIKPIQLGIGMCLYYPMSCVTPKNMYLILKYYIVNTRPHLQIIYVMSKILVIRPY